ncbi:MAG: hypothetical protein IPJ30_07115 [Acidobacteria bacterium]|nr:hypothetical protein [Acidobacteriota bacterium]MBK8147359.1 hypothetical protein [Acidobacteriota bacterium]
MSKFEVSFNSPQCGWMSIGFAGSEGEFHTTTANMPHTSALSELMALLAGFLDGANGEKLLKWNRDPEEFDFRFVRSGDELTFEIYEYATGDRASDEKTRVFNHRGNVREICRAFCETFQQLFEDRDTDEFEFNWRQPFPTRELRELEHKLN